MAIAPFVTPPQTRSFWLVNARLPLALLDQTVAHRDPVPMLASFPFLENLVAADVEIRAGHIAAIAPVGTAPADAPSVDLAKGLILPCFVDLHTHLDKSQTWNRRPNPDGSFDSALQTIRADAPAWRADDLYHRMRFSLRCAYAHGTRALRTHFDAFGDMAQTALTVLQELQQEWRDRITIQAVSLVSLDYYLTSAGEQLADLVADKGGILGGVAYPNPDLSAQVERVFTLAAERDLAIDLHVDESLNPDATALLHVAKAKLQYGFPHSVVCGHACALSIYDDAVAEETLHWVQQAEIGVVSLPMCNLYLQDRQPGRMPRYRGVTLLHELKRQGIPVAVASDNCRDAFHAYGDYDGLEVFAQSARIGHLDRPVGDWIRAVTWTPADLMGLPTAGRLGLNQPADLVLFKARTFNELLSRPQSDRAVLRKGAAISTTPPDYAELDDLLGLS